MFRRINSNTEAVAYLELLGNPTLDSDGLRSVGPLPSALVGREP